jgi:hypothetical protein
MAEKTRFFALRAHHHHHLSRRVKFPSFAVLYRHGMELLALFLGSR